MSTEPTPIEDTCAAELIASYDATSESLEQSGEEKATGMMTDELLVRAYERTNGEQGDAEADALSAKIERRCLNV